MKQAEFCDSIGSIVGAHSRAIAHLRSQMHGEQKRIGIVMGAGVSRGIGSALDEGSLPDWPTLVRKIAEHPEVEGTELINDLGGEKGEDGTLDLRGVTKTLSSVAQILFQKFRMRYFERNDLRSPIPLIDQRKINTAWMRIVHGVLYDGIATEEKYERAIKAHPYLGVLIEVIRDIPLTVNFNFDDTVERLLFLERNQNDRLKNRGFEVILEPSAQISRAKAVIFHPNGILPFVFEDGASTEIVFSDDAFHDQISSIASGRSVLLTQYLFSNTCIFIGLSLEDISLQQTLRQNAVAHPGHIHYVVYYMPDGQSIPFDARCAIFRSNFDTFGVYTFFLNNDGIRALFEAINMGTENFRRDFSDHGIKFVYYLIGAVGVGKSTAVKNFQSLRTYDEWVDRRLPAMAGPDSELTGQQRKEVDKYVVSQFGKKNFCIAAEAEFIHIIDRCPLDPLTFGDVKDRPRKARELSKEMKKGRVSIESGHLLWLDCSAEEIAHRKSRKHKNWPRAQIDALLSSIETVYGELRVSRISTHGRTALEVARELAWIIFVDEYKPADIGSALRAHGSAR